MVMMMAQTWENHSHMQSVIYTVRQYLGQRTIAEEWKGKDECGLEWLRKAARKWIWFLLLTGRIWKNGGKRERVWKKAEYEQIYLPVLFGSFSSFVPDIIIISLFWAAWKTSHNSFPPFCLPSHFLSFCSFFFFLVKESIPRWHLLIDKMSGWFSLPLISGS